MGEADPASPVDLAGEVVGVDCALLSDSPDQVAEVSDGAGDGAEALLGLGVVPKHIQEIRGRGVAGRLDPALKDVEAHA